MSPDDAACLIQRAWCDYVRRHMSECFECEYSIYPDRPVDYEGMWEVINEYRIVY